MKKILLLIILFYCISVSYAQERFFNLYPGWEITHVEEGSSEHLLFGSDTLYSGNSNTPIRIKITESGNFIEYDRYVSDTIYGFSIYSSESYSIHDNYTMASGVYIEYFKNYVLNPVLMFFNNEDYYCDSILDFKSDFNNRLTILRFHREVGNKIHLFGTSLYDEDWNAKTFFAIYDLQTGDFTMKDYPKPSNCVMTPYQALPTPDGGYLLACEQDMTYLYSDAVYACILKIDSEGNEQWRYIIPSHNNIPTFPPDFTTANYRPRIFNAPDDNYWVVWTDPDVISGYELQVNPVSTIRIAKLRDNITSCEFVDEVDLYSQLDNFYRYQYLINDSYQDEQGNMYLLLQSDGGYISALVKICSNGVGAWLRTYKCYPEDDAWFSNTELYGITPTSDNGFMLTGKFYSPSSTLFPNGMLASCVFKVDSCGCFDAEGCNANCADTYAEYFVNMAEASIFPNPASNEITVGFDYEGGETEFEYKIYSLDGKLLQDGSNRNHASVLRQSSATEARYLSINICDLPSGYYMIQFWGGGKIFTGKFVKE